MVSELKRRALRTAEKTYMRYATFINFTEQPFTGYWNGKPYTFQPGERKEKLNALIARHFAKHLTNKVLIEAGKETLTSPKMMEDVKGFMDVFNKAFAWENQGKEADSETGMMADDLSKTEPSMNINVVPAGSVDPYDASKAPAVGPGSAPQVIGEEIADEDGFEGK